MLRRTFTALLVATAALALFASIGLASTWRSGFFLYSAPGDATVNQVGCNWFPRGLCPWEK